MDKVTFILSARTWQEVFPETLTDEERDKLYKQLRVRVHPDRHLDRTQEANDAWNRLTDFYTEATTPQLPKAVIVISTIIGDVTLQAARWRSEGVSWLEANHLTPGELYAAAAKNIPQGLLSNGLSKLKDARSRMKKEFLGFFPEPVDTVTVSGGANGDKEMHLLRLPEGNFLTLREVNDMLPNGIDGRDTVWILKRVLVALGNLHDAGICYNGISMDAVLIEAEQHGVVLKDWQHATSKSGLLPTPSKETQRLGGYSDEVLNRQKAPDMASDLRAAGIMFYMITERPIAKPLNDFLESCPTWTDARSTIVKLDAAARAAYGEPKFHEMKL